MTELRHGLHDLEDAVRNKFEDMEDRVKRFEQECQIRMDQLIETVEENRRLLARIAEEITEGLKEVRASPTRKGSKRKYDEERDELCEKRRIYAQRLRDREEELREIDRFLSENVVRARRFGDRTMKTHESTLACVFCGLSGKHYSDACPKVRTVDER
ncbi:hypothetical protein GCK32_010719 [Trichostrongylus colubriformis]|uniref:CCHC-type domain-containing protein n=1 Tax=Trichostrongylus colubriformis TaxID=6319 RepID=A0AAN8FL57_TRICO